jgi:hypothetical protein
VGTEGAWPRTGLEGLHGGTFPQLQRRRIVGGSSSPQERGLLVAQRNRRLRLGVRELALLASIWGWLDMGSSLASEPRPEWTGQRPVLLYRGTKILNVGAMD